jgi:PAS domain-containing protein
MSDAVRPPASPPQSRPGSILTIPSSDAAFAEHVQALSRRYSRASAAEFEQRLRNVFPRVAVRERSLSGEPPAWYVYRDGRWRPPTDGPWWVEPRIPRLVVSDDGWIVEASRTASDLLGIEDSGPLPHHFTDFVVPGALEESLALHELVKQVGEFEATVLLRPLSGEVIAVDIHVAREGEDLVARIRLADDVDVPVLSGQSVERPRLTFTPATDAAFRGYAERALARMPEPTAMGLELRLHRIYPHARVSAEGDAWEVWRDSDADRAGQSEWWLERGVARVRFDAQALILEANEAATELFARELVGHHWQEFVTPGSTEQVSVVLEILAEVGAAESRFRIPRPDGSLLEFHSYTEVVGDEFVTSMKPVGG